MKEESSSHASQLPQINSTARLDTHQEITSQGHRFDTNTSISFGHTPVQHSKENAITKVGTPMFSPPRPLYEEIKESPQYVFQQSSSGPFYGHDDSRSKSTMARESRLASISLRETLDPGRLSRLSQCDLIGRRNDRLVRNLTRLTDSLSQCKHELETMTASPSPSLPAIKKQPRISPEKMGVKSLKYKRLQFPRWLMKDQEFKKIINAKTIDATLSLDIVQMQPETRSTGAKRILANWLYSTEYFSRFALNVSVQIAEHIEHKHVEAGEVIVTKGTTANQMYVIFSGKVGVYLERNVSKPSIILGEKVQFGAEALERNAKRAAYVIAEEPTQLLVVKSGAFNSIIGSYSSQELFKDVKFLRQIDYFRRWDHERLQKFCNKLFHKVCKKGEQVVEADSTVESLFIIRSGSFKAQKMVNLESNHYYPVSASKWESSKVKRRILYDAGIMRQGEMFGAAKIFEPGSYLYAVKVTALQDDSTCMCLNIKDARDSIPYSERSQFLKLESSKLLSDQQIIDLLNVQAHSLKLRNNAILDALDTSFGPNQERDYYVNDKEMKRKMQWVKSYEERKKKKQRKYRSSFFLGETIEREIIDKSKFNTLTIQKHEYHASVGDQIAKNLMDYKFKRAL